MRAFLTTWFIVASLAVAQEEPDDDRPIVAHAGGVVQLRPPIDWHVSEVPFGREVRLVLSPSPLPEIPAMPNDGIWIVVHARANSANLSKEGLSAMLDSRVTLTTDGDVTTEPETQFTHQSLIGVRQRFKTIVSKPGRSGQYEGVHVLLRGHESLIELHAEAPYGHFPKRTSQIEETIKSLVLRKPARIEREKVADSVAAASTVLGSWKAYRSRLQLYGNGRIVIKLDGKKKQSGLLMGRFAANDDLIFVTWDDNSRLNFRWRLYGDNLLLTDHDGQISQLRRIFE